MSSVLEAKSVSVIRSGELVLEDVSFALSEGQVIGLTGPNGAGKSTLFNAIAGFLPVSRGELVWHRAPLLAYLPQRALYRKTLPLTVKDYVAMGTWGPKRSVQAALNLTEALQVFELETLKDQLMAELSAGQIKRASMARCLVQPADLYLMDEPFNQLDITIEARLGSLLQDLSRKFKKAFFVISHDWHAMDHYFDHLILLSKRIISQGTVRDVNEVYNNWKDPKTHQCMHHQSVS